MDEYFCANCGAILNNQLGFDPSLGTWRCTECGKLLMDDDVYDGDSFEGVAWFCDNCNALLNRQYGFSDSLGSWQCTNCGHINSISESEIINEDDDNSPKCPNCGSNLEKQFGYYVFLDDCTCEECGAKLHRGYSSDPFEVVEEEGSSQKCPHCGSNLEKQSCYFDSLYDCTCEECGAKLHRSYSSDPFEVVEEEDDSLKCPHCGSNLEKQSCYFDSLYDWTCEECGTRLHRRYCDDPFEEVEDEDEKEDDDDDDDNDDNEGGYCYVGGQVHTGESGSVTDYPKQHKAGLPHPQSEHHERIKSRDNRAKRKKKPHGIKAVLMLFLVFGILIGIAYLIIPTIIPVRYDSTDLIGQEYHSVVSCLKGAGFTYVTTRSVEDLTVNDIDRENTVDSIQIAWFDDFSSKSKYPSFVPVVVTYHALAKI